MQSHAYVEDGLVFNVGLFGETDHQVGCILLFAHEGIGRQQVESILELGVHVATQAPRTCITFREFEPISAFALAWDCVVFPQICFQARQRFRRAIGDLRAFRSLHPTESTEDLARRLVNHMTGVSVEAPQRLSSPPRRMATRDCWST